MPAVALLTNPRQQAGLVVATSVMMMDSQQTLKPPICLALEIFVGIMRMTKQQRLGTRLGATKKVKFDGRMKHRDISSSSILCGLKK